MGARDRMRGLALLAALALLATSMFVAQSPASAAPPLKVGIAYDGAAIKGNPYNELTAMGVARAASEYKLKVFEAFSVDKRGRPVDRLAVLTQLARRNPNLVLAVGFLYGDAIVAAAAANPRTNFAIVDSEPATPASNLQGILFAENEGSFLVGAAAALKSTSLQIGFIGGMDIPVIEEFRVGFVAGVADIDPAATVEVGYVSTPGGSGFADPERAYAMALAMYESGIDVIFPVAGGSTIGVTRAARDYSAAHQKVWMIGVDTDFYAQVRRALKPFVLTSMVKRVDVGAYETVKAQATGTFVGGVERFDLAREGVDYVRSGGFVHDIVPTLEALRAAIIAGDIIVP